MTDDIVKRLREGAEYEHDTATMADAADEIEGLRERRDDWRAAMTENHDLWREVERLRAALKPLVEAVEHARDNSAFIEHQKAHRVTVSVWQLLCKQVKTARAALEGEKKDG